MELERYVVPGSKVQAEIVKATASFDDLILETDFPVADSVFYDTIAFDAANGVFDANSQRGEPLVHIFLHIGQFFTSGFLFGL